MAGKTEKIEVGTAGEGHEALAAAVRVLAARCDGAATEDGQGFNKIDASLGRSLAGKSPEAWTPRQTRAAYRMLAKYRGQLAEEGIDYAAIAEPAIPERTATDSHRVYAPEGGGFEVAFMGYEPSLVAQVKDIPGRRFDGARRVWRIPEKPEVVEPLVSFISETGIDYSDVVIDRVHEIAGRAEKEAAEREAQIEASRAADADLEVEGLGGELRPFQRAGVAYALGAKRTFLADQMGLGKTPQSLATVHAAGAYPALVVCPASLKLNWKREAEKWLPGKTISVLNGKSASYDADVVIINYDILGKHDGDLKARGFKALVLDECHATKNHRAKRTQLCRELAKGVEVRLLLSGTPLLNRPQELISQLDILGRLDEFGGFWQFAERYCAAYRTRWGLDLSGSSNLDELNEKLRGSCYVRRTKDQVLKELPAKQRAVLPMSLTNRREYERAERELIQYLGEVAANDEARIAEAVEKWSEEHGREPGQGEMRRIRSDVRMTAEANAERAEQLVRIEALKQLCAKGKLDAVCEWVEDFLDSGEKLVLFAHHREIVKAIAERFGAPSITGDTPAEARQDAVDAFQSDPDTKLIVLNIQAGGVGLTLTAASDVAFVELGWTPAAHDQAEDRAHRIGQTDSVTAWYLLAEDTIDDEIHELIEAKRAVVDEATEGGETTGAAGKSVVGDLLDRLRRKDAPKKKRKGKTTERTQG